MNSVLIGSVSSSAAVLDALIRAGATVSGVLGLDESQADRVSDYRSLGQQVEGTNIPFRSFVRVTEPAVEEFLRAHQPDLLWAIGLSQLVPDRLICLARYGGVGFHPTILPRGRGRAPVAWTILLGERAAATLFHLTEEADAGDIIAQREVPVLPDDYSEDLIARTNDVLAEVIHELAPSIKAGALPRMPQEQADATYFGKRTPEDGLIDWSQTTDAVYRLVRAAGRPYPGAFSFLGERKVTIWRATPAIAASDFGDAECLHAAGTVVRQDGERGIMVRTGDGALWLTGFEGADADALALGTRLSGPASSKGG